MPSTSLASSLAARSLALWLAACAVAVNASAAQSTRVLFLGNSYTHRNDLPALVKLLGDAGGHSVVKDSHAPGGNTLGAPQANGSAHAFHPTSLSKIAAQPWNFLVLQEQSTIPTIEALKLDTMIPGALTLGAAAAASNPATRVVLYQTWGREFGGTVCFASSCITYPDFGAMQDELTAGYADCADALAAAGTSTVVAPVGEAWRTARSLDPSVDLYDVDGAHPNLAGSYLAACTLYSTIFGESPVGLTDYAGLDPVLGEFLQRAASLTVFGCGFEPFGQDLTPAFTLALAGAGGAFPGEAFELLTGGLPAGSLGAFHGVALGTAAVPLLGSTLLLDPSTLQPLQFVAAGSPWSLSVPPLPAFAGVELYFQSAAFAAGQPDGWAFSHGLRLTTCR